MSKIKLLSIGLLGLLAVNLGMLGFLFFSKPSGLSHERPEHGGDGPKRIIIEKLHFSEAQVMDYERLIQEHRSAIRELDANIRQTKNALYATLSDTSATGKDSLESRLGDLQRTIEKVHYNHFADIKKICTPEQLPYFNALTKELAKLFAPGKNFPPPPKD